MMNQTQPLNASPTLNETQTLAERLKSSTVDLHDQMEVLMAQAQVFAHQQNYAQFTLAQYYFQDIIENLYLHPEIRHVITDIEKRGRLDASLQDLKDLGISPQQHEPIANTLNISPLEALGWIYVSEGSTLGAAFLYKQAQKSFGFSEDFGARNLAAYPEGRMVVWRRFKNALNDQSYSEDQQNQVIQGAKDGFNYFGYLLQNIKGLK